MTVQQIQKILVSIDPQIHHYECAVDGSNFTVWMEYERVVLPADDEDAEMGWRFEVDRFTKDEYDPIAEKLEKLLMNHPSITAKPQRVQYDQASGYIRHQFDCEAI